MPDTPVHACPPDGSGRTPCCHRPPTELPRGDRITSDPEAATCSAAPAAPHACDNCEGIAPQDCLANPDRPQPAAAAFLPAPWTPEQVHALNAFQSGSGMHPFACGRDHGGHHVTLIARADGWHCSAPPCDYRQDWALRFMADPSAWPGTRRLRGLLEHVGTDAAGREPEPAPGPDPALQDRVALAIGAHRNGPASDGRGWYRTPQDANECRAIADTVLAELAPELDALTAARAGDGPWLRAYREDTLAARQAQQHAEAEVQRLGLMVDEYGTGARALSEELRETRAALAETRAIIVDLTDPDPCWYDHHGHCQAHGWTATDPACPHARAKALDAPAEGGPR